MNKVLVALLSAFTVFAASAATPVVTQAPAAVKPTVEMAPSAATPAAKPAAAQKATHVKKVKHVAKKNVMKHKAAEQAAPKV